MLFLLRSPCVFEVVTQKQKKVYMQRMGLVKCDTFFLFLSQVVELGLVKT